MTDIYEYIERCYENEDNSYHDEVLFPDLINEAGDVVDELIEDKTLSYIYPNGDFAMYYINNETNFIELSKLDKDYVDDMKNVFYDIIGGMPYMVTLKLSRPSKRKV